MVISCMYWPKFNAKFGSFFGKLFQIVTLAIYIYCMPLVLWQNIYQCVSYLGLFCITDCKYLMSCIIITMVAYSMSNIWYTLFCVYASVLCVLVVLFRDQALKWVMVPDGTGVYVGLFGWCYIHCKFLSTFRGCALPSKSICINCMLHMDAYQTCDALNYALLYCFWMIFSVSLSSFCIDFHPLWQAIFPWFFACLLLCLVDLSS